MHLAKQLCEIRRKLHEVYETNTYFEIKEQSKKIILHVATQRLWMYCTKIKKQSSK